MYLNDLLQRCPLFNAELDRLKLNNVPIAAAADLICEAHDWPLPPDTLRTGDGMLELEECLKHNRPPNWKEV